MQEQGTGRVMTFRVVAEQHQPIKKQNVYGEAACVVADIEDRGIGRRVEGWETQ